MVAHLVTHPHAQSKSTQTGAKPRGKLANPERHEGAQSHLIRWVHTTFGGLPQAMKVIFIGERRKMGCTPVRLLLHWGSPIVEAKTRIFWAAAKWSSR